MLLIIILNKMREVVLLNLKVHMFRQVIFARSLLIKRSVKDFCASLHCFEELLGDVSTSFIPWSTPVVGGFLLLKKGYLHRLK